MTITVDELQKKLKKISKEMIPAVEKGMTQATMNIEGRAKELCPFITGTLRRSISQKTEVRGTEVKGIVGAGVNYAEAVHDGTNRRMPNPFILNAIMEKERETAQILSAAIEEALKKETN